LKIQTFIFTFSEKAQGTQRIIHQKESGDRRDPARWTAWNNSGSVSFVLGVDAGAILHFVYETDPSFEHEAV
jgi:hypothetical protein